MSAEAKANILLVDDRPENLLALEAVLADLGQNLVKADSGRQALRCVLEQDFAVILLDVQMPGMDGFETAAMIRERERSMQTPIVFLTATSNSDAHVFKGYAAGAVDYLSKPFVPEILRSKVMVFVELHRKTMLLEAANQRLITAHEELGKVNHALKRRTLALEAANKELEAFSYSVSHDLRTPVRHIDGFAELLEKHGYERLDDEGRRYLKKISRSAKQMGMLIDDLLAFSRMGRAELHRTTVNLGRLVKDVVRDLQQDTDGRNIAWTIGSLPEIKGDPAMLRQVLINLIANAVKYTRPREQARIEIGCDTGAQNETVIFVRDNGVGFDMQHAGKLFGVFQRLHSAKQFEGTGIGLANAYRIIARHGGHTWGEGKVNEGATFYFSLPKSEVGGPA
jgi:two-component system, sensor histidine kinase and response regulator